MEIVHVQIKESGTEAKSIRSTTAGLATAYQKVGNATLSASAVATTGGYILIEMASFPWESQISEQNLGAVCDSVMVDEPEAEEGYKAMAAENSLLAEEFLPIALESWPAWKE